MNNQEKRFAFAVAAMIGLISRGATPAEIRDTMWMYADFAVNSEPKQEYDNE